MITNQEIAKMKKIYKSVLIILAGALIILSMTACSSSARNKSSEKLLIESGDYYKIYDGDLEEAYEIYNAKGELVRSYTTDSPLNIEMLNSTTVDISEGIGTGITQHTYYNAEKDIFSDDFTYVLCAEKDMIAYVGKSANGTDNKTLIIQNIFDKENYYKEYEDVFENADNYEISSAHGTFSDDFSALTINYNESDSNKTINQTISL